MHQHIVIGTPCQNSLILLACFLCKYRHHLAKLLLMHLMHDWVKNIEHPVEAILNDILRHLIFHSCRRGACPLGINKGKRGAVTGFADDIQGFLEILLRFPGEAHDDIRAQGDIRHCRSCLAHQLHVGFLCIMAVHAAQNFITAALHRQMQIFTYLITIRHCLHQLIGQILRVRGHETNPFNPLHLVHHPQKLCKGNGCFQIFAIGVYILP